ncbi:MAG: hypothetical protein QM767_11785 [Anaeromyxobacter sp.]
MNLRLAPLALLLALAACTPRNIPGTEIPESPDTVAIAQLLAAYRTALEKLDAPGVLALAAPDYYDIAGTPDPSDDVDYTRLQQRLPADLAAIDSMQLDFTLRKIDVQGDRATAEVYFESNYRVKTPSGATVPHRDADMHRLALRRVENAWRITSGL